MYTMDQNITEEYINSRYDKNVFLNNPKFESTICIVFQKQYTTQDPFFSIIIPIYNQEDIIINNLKSIIKNTTEKSYEIILIIDSCSDNTENRIVDYISSVDFYDKSSLITNILILKSVIPLFETTADNLGFYCSRGNYCLEIQADMEIMEPGYNMKLLIPFFKNSQIIGMSGRCCHGFISHDGIGKLGKDITKSIHDIGNIDKNCYYIYDTCNRGPLLLDKQKLQQLGYLDEVNYFLDNSDHDLFLRANLQKQWLCGYVPIEFNAHLQWGSTRKKRDKLNEDHYQYKRLSTNNSVNGFYNNNVNKVKPTTIQKYSLYE